MLIRDEQMIAFRDGVRRLLENRLLDHVARYFPRHIQVCGREPLRPVVQRAIDGAREYGMVSEPSATTYLDVMLLLGFQFDQDPLVAFARRILVDPQLDERSRAASLYDAVKEYWKRVGGPDSRHWAGAIGRFGSFPLDWPPQDPSGLKAALVGQLAVLYPAKTGALTETEITALLELALAQAKAFALTTAAGVGFVAALMVLLGTGCCQDPRFAWIAAALREKADPPADRLKALQARALVEFRRWLPEGKA